MASLSSLKATPGSDGCPSNYIGMDEIEGDTGRILGESPSENLKSSGNVAQPGDVVYGRLRPYLNKVGQPTERVLCSGELLVLRPHEGVLPSYLAHLLRSRELVRHSVLKSRGDRPRVYWDELAAFETALPPTSEQGRIVSEVERRTSQLEAAEKSMQSALRKLGKARAAVLRAATDGSLLGAVPETDAARICKPAGTPYEVIPERPGWVRVRIDSIAKVGSGSTPKRGNPRFWNNGSIPWVTSGQVVGGIVREPAELITDAALAETSVKLWPAGTLLVAMYGEGRTRGHCAELAIDATCNQACAAIVLHPDFADVQPYLKLVLQARYEENRVLGSGGVQENLNLGLIKSIVIDLPPKEVRDALASEVDRRLSLLDAAEAGVSQQIARCERLRWSVLTAAFAGRLIPQNPNDEPAEQLLERIRSAQEASTPQKRTRRAAKEFSR